MQLIKYKRFDPSQKRLFLEPRWWCNGQCVNKSIESSVFPDKLKEAQVVPLHTKKEHFRKGKLQTCQYPTYDIQNF